MLHSLVETCQRAVSGAVASDDVAAIVRYHRIQASPGLRAAAHYVMDVLDRLGIEAELLCFPARHGASHWAAPAFQEWHANSARLDLIEPAEQARQLADFACPISLIQRSIAFEGTAEVVLLQEGLDQADYAGLDLRGKVVLTRGHVEQVRQLAVEQHGAVGILFYGMCSVPPVREAMDLPDARQYTSFWWSGHSGEKKCFGFVLSPRQGEWLAAMVRRRARDRLSPVKVRAQVDARLYDGQFEVVSALIRGKSEQEVVLVAHLCHPKPSAVDNASGAAAALETARALKRLIDAGELPQPRRSIRFLWLPEMLGSYAYLAAHPGRRTQMIAGLNLDMVGGDQDKNGATLLLEMPPDASSSFVPELLAALRQELLDQETVAAELPGPTRFRSALTSFYGGSDHQVFSHPDAGVPMAMLGQLPDRFYHTSADTLDKIDPEALARAAVMAGAFLLFGASAGEQEVAWLAHRMAAGFEGRLVALVQNAQATLWSADAPADGGQFLAGLACRFSYLLDRQREALASLRRLAPGCRNLAPEMADDAAAAVERQLDRVRRAQRDCYDKLPAAELASPAPVLSDGERRAMALVPRRLFPGPAPLHDWLWRLSPDQRMEWNRLQNAHADAGKMTMLADYWADGRRSIGEIIDLVALETGRVESELLLRFFDLLAQVGLAELCAPDLD